MTRSADFTHTVKHGVRASQPHLVVHAGCCAAGSPAGPRVGFVVPKSVGNAVARHRVSRQLRHAIASFVDELRPTDRLVVRALPGSLGTDSVRLSAELRAGVDRAHELLDRRR